LAAALEVEPTVVGEETAPAVARIARRLGAGTLVVMSKRASGLPGMLLGSVAQGLLALSPCPVLVVRPGEGRTEEDGG
jgi:nucleotide-binding universal stress UspA family protein